MKMTTLVEKFLDEDNILILHGDKFFYGKATIGNNDKVYPAIQYTVDEEPGENDDWAKWLFENYKFNLTAENEFILSLLHELGHHYTLCYFEMNVAEKTTEIEEKMIDDLLDQFNDDWEQMRKKVNEYHFNLPHEKLATEWAIASYNANIKYMRKWSSRFNSALKHYRKNKTLKIDY